MKRYKMQRTTLGHRYYVRQTEDEIAEKIRYNIALVVVPFVSAALMFLVWVKMG